MSLYLLMEALNKALQKMLLLYTRLVLKILIELKLIGIRKTMLVTGKWVLLLKVKNLIQWSRPIMNGLQNMDHQLTMFLVNKLEG